MERSRVWLSIELFDLVFFGYLFTICILSLVYGGGVDQIVFSLTVHVVFAVTGFVVLWGAGAHPGPISMFCRIWYVPFLYVFIFEALGRIIHLLQPGFFDAWVLRMEEGLFGGYPTVWLQERARWWLTDIMAVFYMSYYVVPLVLGVALYRRKEWRYLNDAILTTSMVFFFCFLHFLVMPVAGPIFIPDSLPFELVSLKGGPVTAFEQWLFAHGAIRGGAFPSSHVAVAVAVMVLAIKYRFWRFFYVVVVGGLAVSTIYHGYHYGVDVLYGAVAGVLAALVSPALNGMWRGWWMGNRVSTTAGVPDQVEANQP